MTHMIPIDELRALYDIAHTHEKFDLAFRIATYMDKRTTNTLSLASLSDEALDALIQECAIIESHNH